MDLHGRRLATAGVAAVAALCLASTGCDRSPSRPGAATSPSPTLSPTDTLLRAAKALDETPYTFTLKSPDGTGEGAVDPPADSGKFKVVITTEGRSITIEMLVLGEQRFVKIDLLTGTKWARVDINKIKPEERDDLEIGDPASAADLFAGIVTAEKTGEGRYKGVLDLVKAKTAGSGLVDSDHLKALGDQARSVPFEATVDKQGRLTGLKVTTPATGGQPEAVGEITYSDFGTKPNLTAPPPDQVIEAPQKVYDVFNQ